MSTKAAGSLNGKVGERIVRKSCVVAVSSPGITFRPVTPRTFTASPRTSGTRSLRAWPAPEEKRTNAS